MRGEQPDQAHTPEVNPLEQERIAEREVRRLLSELREYLQFSPHSLPRRNELLRLIEDAVNLANQNPPPSPPPPEGEFSETLGDKRWMESEHTLRKEIRAEIKDSLSPDNESDHGPKT